MKKHLILSIMLATGFAASAQIKVWQSNTVTIGPAWGLPSEALFVNGEASFSCIPASSGISLISTPWSPGIDIPSILPQWGNTALIGTPSLPFWRIYSNELWSLSGAVYAYSDSRLKENVRPIISTDALSKILAMKSYKYDYKPDLFKNDSAKTKDLVIAESKNKLGMLAQELKEVLPEAVKQDEQTGYYSVNYIAIIPMLVEAIKAQQARIDSLEQQIITLTK